MEVVGLERVPSGCLDLARVIPAAQAAPTSVLWAWRGRGGSPSSQPTLWPCTGDIVLKEVQPAGLLSSCHQEAGSRGTNRSSRAPPSEKERNLGAGDGRAWNPAAISHLAY